MCDENLNEILSLDFSAVTDEVNWLNSSSNVLETVDGQLVIDSDSATTGFVRPIGNLDANNNRIRLKCNLEVEKTDPNGPTEMSVLFQLMTAGNVIEESMVEIFNMSDGINYLYFLDRVYKYDNITTPISLRIIVPDGWQHKVYLSDLVVEDFNFCEDKVRTYFVVDGLLDDALTAKSGGIQLFNWKIDNIETLTPDFFADTTSVGGNPLSQWNFGRANLDGSNRVSSNTQQNTFNPFVDEFKLDFDNVNSFYGGKPLGTINGNNYGVGILEIGLGKPAILNGELNVKKGAFFIDIDYSKSLLIKFDVIINQNSSNVFQNPTYKRTYFIEWNAQTCQKRFYYRENGTEIDQINNGFLSGLTGVEINEVVVGCDESFAPTGQSGNFSYVLDFGTSIGEAGIDYDSYSVPDRFIIEWNGQVFDSGFVGSNIYDQQLIDAGVNPADINTASPSNGSGTLSFQKTSAFPTTAIITVLAPLGGTAWRVIGKCPEEQSNQGSLVEIGEAVCGVNPSSWQTVYIDTQDPENYVPQNGDIIYTDVDLNNVFDGEDKTYRLRVTSGITQTILDYSFDVDENGVMSNLTNCSPLGFVVISGVVNNTCSSGGTGSFKVHGGSLPIFNRFVINEGNVTSQDAIITEINTGQIVNIPGNEYREFLPGDYTWSIPAITDCNLPTDKGFNQIHFNQTSV